MRGTKTMETEFNKTQREMKEVLQAPSGDAGLY